MKKLLILISFIFALSACRISGAEERDPVTAATLCAYADSRVLSCVEYPLSHICSHIFRSEDLPDNITELENHCWKSYLNVSFEYMGQDEDGLHRFSVAIDDDILDGHNYESELSLPDGNIIYSFDGEKNFFLNGLVRIDIYKYGRPIDWVEIRGDGSPRRIYTTSRD